MYNRVVLVYIVKVYMPANLYRRPILRYQVAYYWYLRGFFVPTIGLEAYKIY